MWRRFYLKPFEAFVGLFVIINGALTMFPGSIVRDNLWNLIGYPGIAIPVFQVMAGLMKIVGIAINKTNIEAAGLIMVSSLFVIRAITLAFDGDVTLSDINNITIAFGIIVSNLIRLSQLLNHHKFLFVELRDTEEVIRSIKAIK